MVAILAICFLALFALATRNWHWRGVWVAALAIVVGSAILIRFLFRQLTGGLARLDQLVGDMRQLLSQKFDANANIPVTFHAFSPESPHPILKVVATDINRGAMQLFSPDNTPTVPVAEAVAASVCIPGVFRSRKISSGLAGRANHHFLDGGLVSNLPAWVFDTERAIHSDAFTIVIEIDSEEVGTSIRSSVQWLTQAVRATVFGASDLNTRGVERMIRIPLSGKPLGVMSFDARFDVVAKVVDQAEVTTDAVLDGESERQDTVDRLQNLIHLALSEPSANGISHLVIGDVRVSMAILKKWEIDRLKIDTNHNISVRFIYQAGFVNGVHDLPPLPLADTPEETAIKEHDATYATLSEHDFPSAEVVRDPRKRIVSRYREGVKWLYALPVFPFRQGSTHVWPEARENYFVVIDGNQELPLEREKLDQKLQVVYDIVRSVVGRLAEMKREAPHGSSEDSSSGKS